MRREFLKGYILSLVSEGALAGARSPADAAKRVVQHAASDATAVVTEILGQVAVNGLDELKRRASAVHAGIGEKIGEAVERIKAAGFGEFWREMQQTYRAGVDANARRRD